MPRMNFNYWALHYLNLWLSNDRNFCEALEGHDDAGKLRDLTKAAAFYRVARNLPKAYDVEKGIPRYKPVLDVIDQESTEYSVAPDVATPQYIEGVASQPWFKERVFDVYLWSLGS